MPVDYNQFVDWNSPAMRQTRSIPTTYTNIGGGVAARPSEEELQYDLALRKFNQGQADKERSAGIVFGDKAGGGAVDAPASVGKSDSPLDALLGLLGGATTSEQVQIGDMARNTTGTLPTLTDFVRNLFSTIVSRELGLDQNSTTRYGADQSLAGTKYASDQQLAGVNATNQNRLDILGQEQARQREREGLFQQMAGGLGKPVFGGSNARIRV